MHYRHNEPETDATLLVIQDIEWFSRPELLHVPPAPVGAGGVSPRDAHGALPVHYAIGSGHAQVTRLLATFCHEYDASARLLAWALDRNRRRGALRAESRATTRCS